MITVQNAIDAMLHDPEFDPLPIFGDAIKKYVSSNILDILNSNPKLIHHFIGCRDLSLQVAQHINPQSDKWNEWLDNLDLNQYRAGKIVCKLISRFDTAELIPYSYRFRRFWQLLYNMESVSANFWECLSSDDKYWVIKQISLINDVFSSAEIIINFNHKELEFFLNCYDGQNTRFYDIAGKCVLKLDPSGSDEFSIKFLKQMAQKCSKVESFCLGHGKIFKSRGGYKNHIRSCHYHNDSFYTSHSKQYRNVVDVWPSGDKKYKIILKEIRNGN